MRRTLASALLTLAVAAVATAAQATRDKVTSYLEGWYSVCPGTRILVTEATEIPLTGYEAYRVERTCELKGRNASSVTLVDPARNEIFVGEVLHDDARKGRPFSLEADRRAIEASLTEAYGVPASLRLESGSRGPLQPIRIALQQAPGAEAKLPGFVSQDGATLLLGEFRPLDVDASAYRDKLLKETPGVRPPKGKFFVATFIDFQCERCRLRTPQLRDFVWSRGGALEIYFLPLVKVHDWAFAAAESAAALSNVSPDLYTRYEDALFPRADSMNAAAARQIAFDVADAAGVRAAFDAELSSGRGRDRVVRDVELAMRLGLSGTPAFFYRGAFLTGEKGLAEKAIESGLSAPAASGRAGAPNP
jgi:DSBA-like thioredoxin domain